MFVLAGPRGYKLILQPPVMGCPSIRILPQAQEQFYWFFFTLMLLGGIGEGKEGMGKKTEMRILSPNPSPEMADSVQYLS